MKTFRAALALSLTIAASAVAQGTGAIDVTVSGKTATLSIVELRSLPRTTVRVGDEGDSAIMSGASLWDVLQKVNATSRR